MFKKILLVTALVATASFATWDKFPVLDQGKGQVKLGADYGIKDQWRNLDLELGARFTVIQSLEIMGTLPYRVFGQWDGDDRGDGLGDATIGARYFFPTNLGLFLDINLPIGDDSYAYQGWGFHFGAQYAKVPLIDKISMGSELGLSLYTEGDDDAKYNRGTELNLGVEFDYDLGALKPYVGLDYFNRLTRSEEKCSVSGTAGSSGTCKIDDDYSGFLTTFGVNYSINQMMTIEGKYMIGAGRYFGDYSYIIAANFYFNF